MAICKNCGAQVPDGSKFCGQCGTPVETVKENKFCPHCGKLLTQGLIFCPECGMKVSGDSVPRGNVPKDNISGGDMSMVPVQPGNVPLKSVAVSYYDGECRLGVAKGTGTIIVYRDRVEYKPLLGNQVSTIPMSQISRVYEIKFELVFPAMVVALKNGQLYTFASPVNVSGIKECITLINKYKR